MRFKETSAVHGGIEDSMGASEGGRPYRRDGTDTGVPPKGARGRDLQRARRVLGPSRAYRQGAAPARRTPGGQGRGRAPSRPPSPGDPAQPRVQGPLGPGQAQDHLPRGVRQRRPARAMHPGAPGGSGDVEAPAPVAQSRPHHRPVRRGDDRNRRGGNHAAGRGRRRAAQRAGRASGSDAAHAAEHPAHPLRERTPYSKAWPGGPVE